MERIILRSAAVLTAVSVIFIAFALTKVESLLWKILWVAVAAVPFVLALLLIYLVILAHRRRDCNYFLYDYRRKANMPLEELTVDHVSDCLVRYMMLFRKGKELYLASLFDEAGGAPEAFKPLFCYQILGMMSVCEEDLRWKNFVAGGKELADAFSTYLSQAGEEEMSRRMQYFIAQGMAGNTEEFRSYLREKSDYLAERMLEYTKAHIREFD